MVSTVKSSEFNEVANNYVAWQWKANGGTTSTNTDGSVNSTVQANTDAGFSIVTWAGTCRVQNNRTWLRCSS